MSSKGVTQRVRRGRLVQAGIDDHLPHGALYRLFIRMVAPSYAAARIDRQSRRGKYILPSLFAPRVGIFTRKRER